MPATKKRVIVTQHAWQRWCERCAGCPDVPYLTINDAFRAAEAVECLPADFGGLVYDRPGSRYYRAGDVYFVTHETDRVIEVITVIRKTLDPRPTPATALPPVRKAAIRKAKLRAAKEDG